MEPTSLFQIANKVANYRIFIKKNFFSPQSNSIRYARYRLLRPFLKTYHNLLLINQKNTPWMSPAAIEIFHNILTKQMIGFEFGSGSSTLFLAARVQQLISLEHDRTWYDSIHAKLQIKTTNVEYFLVEPENNEHKKEKYPATAYTNIIHAPAPATCYKLYYSFIDKYPDEHFDFVIVDGRARTECSLHAISKIKKGGFLVLDNAERYRYKTVHDELTGWKKVFTTTGLTDTVFWFKE